MSVTVNWKPGGIRKLFLESEEIRDALQEAGDRIAERNSVQALHYLHSPVRVQPYVAEVRKLRNTQVCVVHSTTKAVAAVGRKHGLPKK